MKKKAFTLTELLVAVVIIGVLSAIVLPKFTKVLETRKTSEAEEMMAAVRTEQEARCMLDKPYVTQAEQTQRHLLASMPKNTGTYFSYTLTNTGIEAQRIEKDYKLSIPSYADGRICCTGTGCDKLDKDYPKCSDLTNLARNEDCEVVVTKTTGVIPHSDPISSPKKCQQGATRWVNPVTGGVMLSNKTLSGDLDDVTLNEGSQLPVQECCNAQGEWESCDTDLYTTTTSKKDDEEVVLCYTGGTPALQSVENNEENLKMSDNWGIPEPGTGGNSLGGKNCNKSWVPASYHTDMKCGGQKVAGAMGSPSSSCQEGKTYAVAVQKQCASVSPDGTNNYQYRWKCVTCAHTKKSNCLTKVPTW
ncbi:MAG: type II secretion system protein [Elusimicrobiaceae bacterium]|nr:type II secretion system protein [Elusimicrobiaceae bacterium]